MTLVYGHHIVGVLNGGHTNQKATFCWSLLHAARTPLLATLRQTKSRALLEATFRETGRLYNNLIVLRRLTTAQTIMGKHIPVDTFVAMSPVVTSQDPNLFPEPEKFRPERWLTPNETFDEEKVKQVARNAESIQFGKGQHACLGEKIARMMILDTWWAIILGNDEHPGYDMEIISGIREGVGVDNVGAEASWAEDNLGTPNLKGPPVMVRFRKFASQPE